MAALRSERLSSVLVLLIVVSLCELMMTVRSEDHLPSSDTVSKELTRNGSTKTPKGPRSTRDLSRGGDAPAEYRNGNSTPGVKDIWLLGLFPLKGSWPGGLGQLPAVQLGIQHVNADPNILPGYRLRMTVNDTECDAGKGMNALFGQFYQSPPKVLVLGAGCSGVSQATAQVSHLWNLVQLSYSSASPALSAKDKYKRFFRVFPPESSFNPARFDLLDFFGWQKVGTIYDGGELFSLTTTDFVKKATERGVKIITAESFVGDPRPQVRNLKKHGARIIIGNFYENKAQVVFCEAYKQQMYGPMYVWIITGFFTPEWWKKKPDDENLHDCTSEQLEEAIQGYFTADALPYSLSEKPGISGKTHIEVMAEYNNITNNTSPSGHQEAPYGYDSVWTVALMLNNSLRFMNEHGWQRKIEHFTYRDEEMAELFLNFTIATHFEGVSGPVMFDENGDRKGLTQIEQLQGNREVKVGVYDPTSLKQGNRIIWDDEQQIIWRDGGVPPRDSLSEKITPRVISAGLFILMTVLASIGIVLSCFFLVFNIRYRHRKYIKMSSPNMNNFILVGAILAFSSIIFGGTGSVLVNSFILLAMCKFYNWTLSLGFSLAFGAMFSKTWRVHKIFTNKKIQRMVIKDYQLMALVCALVLFDVLVLTVWEFVNPLAIITYNTSTEHTSGPVNDNQILILQSRYCESTHMWYFAGVLYAVKGLLLLFGAFLAFETRKVTVPALNDSKFIGISVYNVVVLCLIGVPTAIMIKEQLDAAYTLISLFTFFATALTICLVFIPKALKRNREPHTGTMWMKATESTIVTQRKTCGIQLTTSIGGGGGTSSVGIVGVGVIGGGSSSVERGNGGSNTVTERLELDRIIEENNTLRQALEQCQRRLSDRQDFLPFTDLSSPQTTTQSEDFPLAMAAMANIYPSSSMPSLITDKIYSI